MATSTNTNSAGLSNDLIKKQGHGFINKLAHSLAPRITRTPSCRNEIKDGGKVSRNHTVKKYGQSSFSAHYDDTPVKYTAIIHCCINVNFR